MEPQTPVIAHVGRRRESATLIVLLVALLAGVNWILSPEQALRWLRGLLILPLLWFGPTLWNAWRRSRRGPSEAGETATERYFLSALTLIVLALGIVQATRFGFELWVRLGDHRPNLDGERRVLGLAASAVFIVIGNAVPKILTPLSLLPVHLAERVTSARRFLGRAMVIEGLVLALAFLTLPVGVARTLARWVTVGLLLIVLGAIVWMNAGPTARTP